MNGLALCAGIDGLGLGIELAEPEYRTVVHVERESWAVARLVEWMEAAAMEPAPSQWDHAVSEGVQGCASIASGGHPIAAR